MNVFIQQSGETQLEQEIFIGSYLLFYIIPLHVKENVIFFR